MTVNNQWVPPDLLEILVGMKPRASWANDVLGNLKWLHGRPRFTLAHSIDQPITPGIDQTLEFDTSIEDVGGWYDPGSPTVSVVPETGTYLITANNLWDGTAGGTQRKIRLARDGALVRGDSAPAVPFAEHSLCIRSSMSAGQALSVVAYHDDSSDHDIISRSSPEWRSPLFMGIWMGPYSQDI